MKLHPVLRLISANFVWVIGAIFFASYSFTAPPPLLPIDQVLTRGELRIGVDPSVPPFAMDIGGTLSGLEIDLGRTLGEQLGIPVRFVTGGFDGLYDALSTDQVDILIAALPYDPSRLNRVSYTPDYFDAGIVMVTREDSPIRSMDDAGGARVAYAFGSPAHSEANLWARRVSPFQAFPYESDALALDTLRTDQADAVLTDAVAARLYTHQHQELALRFEYLTSLTYHIAIRSDHFALAVAVTRALDEIQESGELDAIIARWL